jgi:predicted transposase YdaD
MPTPTPHDALFQSMLSHPDNAAGELRSLLPAPLAAAVDWTSLRLEPGHYVDPKLVGTQSDLLFSARLHDEPVLLYLLLEHQSSGEPLMPLRLLSYEVRIWNGWLERQTHPVKQIPAIIAVVLSHAEGGWKHPVSMHELFAPETVRVAGEHLVQFRFVLDDLALRTDDELMARAMTSLAVLTVLLLRNVRTAKDLAERIAHWAHLWRAVWTAPGGREAFERLVSYVLLASEAITRQDLRQALVEAVGPPAGEVAMTLAERLMAEGRAEGEARGRAEGEARGRAEGEARGRAQAVLRVLEARGLELPSSVRDRILGCADLAVLDGWLARAVSCESVEALFD